MKLKLGKKNKRAYKLFVIFYIRIRHKIRVISIFIVFYLDFNLISIQPTQDWKYLFRLGLRFVGLSIALYKSYSNSLSTAYIYKSGEKKLFIVRFLEGDRPKNGWTKKLTEILALYY